MDTLRSPSLHLLTVGQLSQQTGLSKAWIYRLARQRQIPVVRLGRAFRFNPDSVRLWIQTGGMQQQQLEPRGGT